MKTIVLTGGPCAGKTTALNRIIELFGSRGYAVFTLPEAPTLFNKAGVNFLTHDRKLFLESEKALLDFQMQMEDHFARIAKADGRPALIICDRGTMDIAAYMPREVWQAILDETKMNPVELRDKRYDAIIHMCTTAKGALPCYTLSNNASRTETPEEAIAIDNKLIQAWTGHPHLRIVGNDGDFEQKLNRVAAEIAAVLGDPEPVESERKYLVDIECDLHEGCNNIGVYINQLEIFQTYLKAENGSEQRLRKRGEDGHFVYFLTEKHKLTGSKRIEVEQQITPSEYISLLQKADPQRRTLHKIRYCFVWKNQYFELDSFLEPSLPHGLLEIESLPESNLFPGLPPTQFPPFLKIIREVTEDPDYYNANIAKIK